MVDRCFRHLSCRLRRRFLLRTGPRGRHRIKANGARYSSLLSALFYATLIVFNKRIVHTGGLHTATAELDVAFVVVLIYVLVTTGLPHPVSADLPWLAAIGFIYTGVAYLLYFSGLQKLPGQSVALLSYVDPVSALFFAAVILHEAMTPVQILGAVLILGRAVLGERKDT